MISFNINEETRTEMSSWKQENRKETAKMQSYSTISNLWGRSNYEMET